LGAAERPSVRPPEEKAEFMRELLLATLALQAALALSLAVTLVRPTVRVWPPPSPLSWQFYFTWVGTWLHLSGTFLLGVLAWGSVGFPGWVRFGVGAPVLAVGMGSAFWGFHALSTRASLGLGGRLVRGGPYRYSRNPQYVSSFAILAGWGLVSASSPALWACLGATVWYFLAPFVEEPWLRAQFGAEYEAYEREVPRFIGLRRRNAAA
jgi:protein-S-isoprenylcysteine O-methyltransferase Ste14